MGLRLVLLHLQAWRHRASTRGLASLLPAAKATRAPRDHCWAPSSMPGPPSSAHFIRLPLCPPSCRLTPDASISARPLGPSTWIRLLFSPRCSSLSPPATQATGPAPGPRSTGHPGLNPGPTAEGMRLMEAGVVDRLRAAPSLPPSPAPVAIPGSCCSGHLGRGGGETPSCHHFMLLLGK